MREKPSSEAAASVKVRNSVITVVKMLDGVKPKLKSTLNRGNSTPHTPSLSHRVGGKECYTCHLEKKWVINLTKKTIQTPSQKSLFLFFGVSQKKIKRLAMFFPFASDPWFKGRNAFRLLQIILNMPKTFLGKRKGILLRFSSVPHLTFMPMNQPISYACLLQNSCFFFIAVT